MLQVFDARQLSCLIGGRSELDAQTLLESIDWSEARLGAAGFVDTAHQVPQFLREVITDEHAFGAARRSQFFRWVTGRCAVPLGGLDMKIELRLEAGGLGDETRLPRVQTCSHALFLPAYTSVGALRQRLLLALVHRNDGFHLQ